MGRKDIIRSIVTQCFLKQANSKLYQCQYCSQQYALNVTRMSEHLLKKCTKCPKKIKADINQRTRASALGSTDATSKSKTTATAKTIVEPDDAGTDPDENSNNSSTSMTIPQRSPAQSSSSTTATTNPRSTGSLGSAIDDINQSEEEKVWELLARACYASNTPLNFTENVHWKTVFKQIKPSLRLPSRHQLSNSLLEKEHARIRQEVIEKIKRAKTVGIQVDGLNNVIITTPEPVLYKVIAAKTNRHDANYLCSLLSSVIDEVGLDKVMTIIADDAGGNMRETWELLGEKYSSGYFSCYGCCAHILSQLIDDVLKIEVFSSTAQICKAIVGSVKRTRVLNLNAHVQEEQHGLDKSSMIFCLQSLRLNKQNLKRLVVSAENVPDVLSADVGRNILDDSFWQNVDTMYCLLRPISEHVVHIRTSKSCVSEVVEIFFNLNSIFNENCPLVHLDAVRAFLLKRKQTALRTVHFAANLLDPKYMGENLNSDEYIHALTYINELSSHLIGRSNVGQVMTEVALYKAKEELFAKDFLWTALSSGTLSSVVWWKSLCSSTILSKVAVEILNCPATTCATEISSAFSNIRNRKRNNLTNDGAAKLLFVSYNLKLGEPKALLQNDEPCTSQQSNAFALGELMPMSDSECDSDCGFLSE